MAILSTSSSQTVLRPGNRVFNDKLVGTTPFVGPLDAYTTGLQAMLLPFRGLTSYTGNCFTIRDTNDDSTQDVGFAANGDCNPFTTVGNAAMATWYNQLGTNNASAPSNVTQPFVIQNVINGLPVVRMDGVDDYYAATIANGVYTRSIYIVTRKRSAQTGSITTYASGLGSTSSIILGDSSVLALAGGWGYRASGISTTKALGGDVQTSSLITIIGIDAFNGNIYVNNGAATAFDPTAGFNTSTSATTNVIGSSGADVDVMAQLYYNATHDDTTRQSIQTILATKFGITLA